MPQAWQDIAYRCTNFFSALISGLLVRAAYVFVRDEFNAKTALFGKFPLWIFISIILFGFTIITFRFLIRVLSPSHSARSAEGGQ
jgi:TRAP-type C4-dicarboxylate transport system permease small subunit